MATGPAVSIDISGMQFAAAAAPLFGEMALKVAPGEVVALIGPSGVGKTTLLRMVAGLQRGFGGQITVGGLPADQAPPAGFVFQDARLLPWLDAAGNIRAVKPELAPDQIETLLRKVGLGGQAGAFPSQLSGGMQRRLGLARAIAAGSGLLLLDEPFVSLDRAVVEELQHLFRSIFAAEHPTVIVVSHDPEDAAQLADRVVIVGGKPVRIRADFRLPQAGARGPQEVAAAVKAILAAQREEP